VCLITGSGTATLGLLKPDAFQCRHHWPQPSRDSGSGCGRSGRRPAGVKRRGTIRTSADDEDP